MGKSCQTSSQCSGYELCTGSTLTEDGECKDQNPTKWYFRYGIYINIALFVIIAVIAGYYVIHKKKAIT